MNKTFAKYSRRWMESEIQTFAEILAILENNFVISSEKLALKKSANNEVFEHIRDNFELEMDN